MRRFIDPRVALFAGASALIALAPTSVHAQQQNPPHQDVRDQQQMDPSDMQGERVASEVTTRLARSPSLAGSTIAVSVEDNTLTLEGTVGSESDRERALRIARQTSGVREVQDQLQVDSQAVADWRASGEGLDDEQMAQQIAQKLGNETFPAANVTEEWLFGWEVEGWNWEFDVDVDEGFVTLEGTVGTLTDITDAVQAVREVPGVQSVDSELELENEYDSMYDPYWGPWYWRGS